MTWNESAQQFTDVLACANPTPGGGAAAAMAGAMGCALVLMALRTTLKRKNTPALNRPVLQEYVNTLDAYLKQLQGFCLEDAKAYEAYLAAVKKPKEDPSRNAAVQEALWQAALVPADTARACKKVLTQLEECTPLIDPVIVSDAHCGRHLLTSAVACCVENIRVNAAYISQPERAEKLQKLVQSLS